ncbi:RNA polymerase factor sigma-54 [Tengunoibacter tsumagoiensis]|uniref:RNA polymerase sigma-54 factor n=1 Tax=Tengunoibacter tsumagoiensis TaxID=2014871 RepID=A0A402A269_9CHLR|nr:RNA polymerase factor sigma-54 [Tengunoibacter tsumagoiensis]GCE13091.1 RNA polymerase sigma-54 factor [Tengunoibacter tsumagoiensis]
MRLEPRPRPSQVLRVSARLITSSTILHLSADELEHTVNQEQTENPALEVKEERVCLFCGTLMYSQRCLVCGRFVQTPQPLHQSQEVQEAENLHEPPVYVQQTFYEIDAYESSEGDQDEDFDPLAHIAISVTLEETLLQQLEALVTPDDAVIAENLVGNLNEHGYLEISTQEIAEYLQVPLERVEYVLSQLQTLEPLGIGARTPRECLLIQLHSLSEQQAPHPLAALLIEDYFDDLAHNQYQEIARRLKVPEAEVQAANQYIRETLHPFPAYIYRPDSRYEQLGAGGATTYIHPDVLIRGMDGHYEVDLIEDKRYQFSTRNPIAGQASSPNPDLQRYMQQQKERANFFIDCLERRWRTLRRVSEFVVEYQKGFLQYGIRSLRPLTRAEVAAQLHLDEGTVSRATANKYALLPNGRLIPLSDFFDGSLRIKDMLRELIQSESAKHRFSDEELARQLSLRGVPLARRTVTKYREEMGIGSSRERGL